MASPFDQLDAQVSATVNAAFGEAATLHPMTGNGRSTAPAADNSRPVKTLTVNFALAPNTEDLAGQRRGSEMLGTTRIAVSAAEAFVTKAEADALGYRIAKGDRLILHTRTGSPAYQISAPPQLYDTGDVNLILVREDPT